MRPAVLLALLFLLPASPVRAQGPPPAGTRQPRPAVAMGCRLDARRCWSFATGTVDVCRGHLAYERGALDCHRYGEQVCDVWLPDELAWTEAHQPLDSPLLLPCPDGPAPPVCPRLR